MILAIRNDSCYNRGKTFFLYAEESFERHPMILELLGSVGFLRWMAICGDNSGTGNYSGVIQAVASAACSQDKCCCPLLHVYE